MNEESITSKTINSKSSKASVSMKPSLKEMMLLKRAQKLESSNTEKSQSLQTSNHRASVNKFYIQNIKNQAISSTETSDSHSIDEDLSQRDKDDYEDEEVIAENVGSLATGQIKIWRDKLAPISNAPAISGILKKKSNLQLGNGKSVSTPITDQSHGKAYVGPRISRQKEWESLNNFKKGSSAVSDSDLSDTSRPLSRLDSPKKIQDSALSPPKLPVPVIHEEHVVQDKSPPPVLPSIPNITSTIASVAISEPSVKVISQSPSKDIKVKQVRIELEKAVELDSSDVEKDDQVPILIKSPQITHQPKKKKGSEKKLPSITIDESDEKESDNESVDLKEHSTNEVPLKYTTTNLQSFYYELATSDNPEISIDSKTALEHVYIHEGHLVSVPMMDVGLLEKIVQIVVLEFPVLRTSFYKNPLIIDADLEAHLAPKSQLQSLIPALIWKEGLSNKIDISKEKVKYYVDNTILSGSFTAFSTDEEDGDGLTMLESFQNSVKKWINSADPGTDLIKILSFQSPKESQTFLVFIVSKLIADERSCSWFAKTIISLYDSIKASGQELQTFSQFCSFIRETLPIEPVDFIDYAKSEAKHIKPPSSATHFWKGYLVESLTETVVDQKIISSSVDRLKKTFEALKSLRDISKKKKEELTVTLHEAVDQRKKLGTFDHEELESGLVDDSHVRIELMKVILKEEFGSETLIEVLQGQGISREVIIKNKWDTIGLGKFSQLDDEAIDASLNASGVRVLTRDKRKIKSTAAFLRNRFRSCLEEHSRIKFNLERKIAKSRRELSKYSDSLVKYQHEMDMTEDTVIKYTQLLNPPSVLVPVPEVRLSVDQGNSDNPLSATSFWSMNDLSSTVRKVYDNIQVQVDSNLVGDIKRFLKDWHLLHDITNSSGSHDQSKSKPSNLESVDLDSIKLQLSDSVNLMEALVVSAFSILAKHISGHDKFIMGLEHSVRSHDSMKGIMLGPLISTLPFKINCEREMTFQDVFEYVVHSMRVMAHHRYYGVGWINEHIVKSNLISESTNESQDLGIVLFSQPLELPIRLEYISSQEYQRWKSSGLSDLDILALETPTRTDQNSHLVWSPSTLGSNGHDLKLTVINREGTLLLNFQFRKDMINREDVVRWSQKFVSVLECIDQQQQHRKSTVSAIISRFYHSAFRSASSLVNL